jgi:hypothetical protein
MVTASSVACCALEEYVEQLHNRMKKSGNNLREMEDIDSSYPMLVSGAADHNGVWQDGSVAARKRPSCGEGPPPPLGVFWGITYLTPSAIAPKAMIQGWPTSLNSL